MMKKIPEMVSGYDKKKISIAALASHSMLEIAKGAKEEGFKTIAVCEKGREKTYSKYYKARKGKGIIDEVILLDKFQQVLDKNIQQKLLQKNAIFVPHRSFQAYTNFDYDAIENSFCVPMFGNRFLLRAEERNQQNNQLQIMQKAGIRVPEQFNEAGKIKKLCIVKAVEENGFARKFFFCSSEQEFEQKAKKFLSNKEKQSAVIEEFVLGAQVNFNFFHSSLSKELELMGTDSRRQTSLDGFLRLPAEQQAELQKTIQPGFEEAGHFPVTVTESLLEKAFEAGERIVQTTKKECPPGIIGPFALQSAITQGNPKKEIVVFDASFRMPGSPGITATPYSGYLHGQAVSMGKRIAMEIKQAIKQNRLEEILT